MLRQSQLGFNRALHCEFPLNTSGLFKGYRMVQPAPKAVPAGWVPYALRRSQRVSAVRGKSACWVRRGGGWTIAAHPAAVRNLKFTTEQILGEGQDYK